MNSLFLAAEGDLLNRGMFGIGIKSADTHRAAIMRKLSLATFSDLVRYAIRNHIIEP